MTEPAAPRPLATTFSRRGLLGRAVGLGVGGLLVAPGPHAGTAQPADNRVRWISPRGTIDALDDYAYWVALRFGYFGDIETSLAPGQVDATAGTGAVAAGVADVAYPTPDRYARMIAQAAPLLSVFQLAAADPYDFAFPAGAKPTSLAELEGRSIMLGALDWRSMVDPILVQAGVDISHVAYVEAGQGWGQALAQGRADAGLCWEGLRAQWVAAGLGLDYILGRDWSAFPGSSFVIRQADAADPTLTDLYTRYLRGWAMGLEFGRHNPRAAAQITVEARPALNDVFPDKAVAVAALWELANVYRGRWADREGWGWHDVSGWDSLLQAMTEAGQLGDEMTAEPLVTNGFVAGANDFDRAQVIASALDYELSEEFAAVPDPSVP